jgi:hypothetical protein
VREQAVMVEDESILAFRWAGNYNTEQARQGSTCVAVLVSPLQTGHPARPTRGSKVGARVRRSSIPEAEHMLKAGVCMSTAGLAFVRQCCLCRSVAHVIRAAAAACTALSRACIHQGSLIS